jgi:hypothetical protein
VAKITLWATARARAGQPAAGTAPRLAARLPQPPIRLSGVPQEWLLVETLGSEPVVVAQGRQMKNFVPITDFLRRNPNLAAIRTAVAETVAGRESMTSITPKNSRVIRTEPVTMSDGRVHGVQVWYGPPDAEPPERPIPGPLKWDLTLGEGTGSPEYLANAGMDPAVEPTSHRAFAEDIPARSLNQDESKALSWAIDAAPDRTYCTTWGFTDKQGNFRRVGWCARTLMEPAEDGTEHLVARALNLVEEIHETPVTPDHLANRIVDGLAEPGVYRAIVDLKNWTLLKWIDDPCPYYNWRGRVQMHPADYEHYSARMTDELRSGTTSAVLRLPDHDGRWVPLQVTIATLKLEDGVSAGLVTLRLATADELAEAGLTDSVTDGAP